LTLGDAVNLGQIGGYIYYQTNDAITNPRGIPDRQRMAQPFCCPKCGTDYSLRPRSSRSHSPIRAFRTGVSKASQMVATEMFELLHAIGAQAKSIVFSDSRQDAANQSLEIERLHLRDLRREILVSAARNCMAEAQRSYVSDAEKTRIETKSTPYIVVISASEAPCSKTCHPQPVSAATHQLIKG
jgi:hydrogenase maturation factor HypF (carbamoyltransferase family)